MSHPEIIATHLFDYSLIEGGNWDSPFKEALLEWVKKPSIIQKENACKIMSSFIINLLGDDISDSGYKKAELLDSNLLHLESILSTTKGELAKKFYRDHINHSIRVLILSKYIIENIKELNFSETEKTYLILSALFHDISYPLSEVYEIYNTITKTMKEIYNSLIFPEFLCSDRLDLIGILLEQIDFSKGLSFSKIGNELNNKNHSVMSSLEFLTYIKNEYISKYKIPLNAILLHDPSFKLDLDISDKIASVLIIADELQDWGRKSSYEEDATITAIDNFKIDGICISGDIGWAGKSSLSPLRQIVSKQSSLNRIKNSGEKINLKMRYVIPPYEILDYRYIEKTISKMLNNYGQKDDLFKNRSNIDVFEERYCGIRGIEYEEISDYLINYELRKSYFKDYIFHIDLQRRECLLLQTKLINPVEIALNFNNTITIKISNSSNQSEGLIKDIANSETLKLSQIISKEFSIIYELVSLKFDSPPYRFWPTSEEYSSILQSFKLSKKEINYLNKSEDIRTILQSQGIFQF